MANNSSQSLPFPFTVGEAGIKLITRETLKQLCPSAAKALKGVDHADTFWVITQKPKQLSEGDEYGDGEEWSETNEPELAEWLAEDWETASVTLGDVKVIFLCGTQDDEYGNFWDNTQKRWVNYMF
jgi:hypothetical protein